ncbi:insulinase family protein [Lacrimispora sp. NSJ-141]|uniref:Insulinase family protein n=1 Tax=Lientehia hominis TaxID=2897778 RepID=A0AAP2RG79_9FIRM|nr:insulinase family protein [Lientehia hominis]MCD2491416.1 insulinase family protein [Lientehia hominis]
MKKSGFDAYEKIKEKDIEELNSKAEVLRHKKSGARIFLLSNEDENKVFAVGFRTPVSDSTGVPHIMEHSVLCGSEKFPVKDPFVELVKGSLNTFLNAMTYSDKTVYPVASCNDKDFQNLMDVYLDAVFHPNIYHNEMIFKQEGWHYELENEEGPLALNGVVYNEMKGVFSSPESVLDRYIRKVLFPDTTYRFESGGDPEEIPELTYEQFLEFHRTYYHPSNSYIYLYGNMDMEEKLRFLDEEYLSHYEARAVDSEITMQKEFTPESEYEIFYPVTEEESEEGKTYLSVNTVVGTDLDARLYVAFQILEYALLSAPGAPLKQALIDAGVGTDIYGGYDSGVLQPVFSVIAKNTEKNKKEQFLSVIRKTLETLAEEGIDEKSLEAGINYYEFKYREADFGPYPKGLMYGLQCFDSWLYDENDPFMHLEFGESFDYLKEHRKDGYFEALITDYLLNNLHQAVIILSPKKGLDKEREEKQMDVLAKKLDSMKAEERRELVRQTEELKEYQQEPSSREALETIPMLSREDIGKEAALLAYQEKEEAGVPVLHTELFTSGIGYLRLAFDAGMTAPEDWPYLGFLKAVLGMVNTERHSYLELFNEINIETGGINTSLGSYPVLKDPGSFRLSFDFTAKAFYDKIGKAFGFIDEILHTSIVEDEKRIYELAARMRSRMKERILAGGHSTAVLRAGSYHSAVAAFGEATSGIDYYRFLERLENGFEKEKETLFRKLRELMERIFRKENLFISFTADGTGYENFKMELPDFLNGLSGGNDDKGFPLRTVSSEVISLEQKNEGFKASSQVQYVARCGNFRDAGYSYTGALRILQVILSYDYLWTQVRVKGGAYGVMSGFGRSGDGYFVSYRDPNLGKTSRVFEGVPEYLRNFQADERDMTKYIIGTISSMDTPMNPSARGGRDMMMYLSGITQEMLQKERDQVIGAGEEDIRALAGITQAVLDTGDICALGNDGKIEAEKQLFKETKRLF